MKIDDYRGPEGLTIDGFLDCEDQCALWDGSTAGCGSYSAQIDKAEAIKIIEHLRIVFDLPVLSISDDKFK